MATFNITVPAQTNEGEVNELSMLTNVTLPSDYIGSNVTGVAIVGTPSITTNSGPTDDDLLIRLALQNNTGNIVGDYNSNTTCVAYANLPDGVSSDNWTDGSSPTGLPRTGASGDFSRVGVTIIVTPNMKNDGETIDWASFQIQVTYTPVLIETTDWRWYLADNSDPDSCTALEPENTRLNWVDNKNFALRMSLDIQTFTGVNLQLKGNYGSGWVNIDSSNNNVEPFTGTPTDGTATDTPVLTASTTPYYDGEYDSSDGLITIADTSGTLGTTEVMFSMIVLNFPASITGGEVYEFALFDGTSQVSAASSYTLPDMQFWFGDAGATQHYWRCYTPDDTDPDNFTALEAQNTQYANAPTDTNISLRMTLNEQFSANKDVYYRLQYQVDS